MNKKDRLDRKKIIKKAESSFRHWMNRYYREGAKLDNLTKKGLKAGDPAYDVQRKVTLTVMEGLEKAQYKLLNTKMAGKTDKEKTKIIHDEEKKAKDEKRSRKKAGKWTGYIEWTSKS